MPSQKLQELRQRIDQVDERLIELLALRFQLTGQVGHLKKTHNLPPADPQREAQQMQRIHDLAARSGVDPALAQQVLRLVIDRVVEEHRRL